MSQDHKKVQKIIGDIEKEQTIEAYAKQLGALSADEIAELKDYRFNNAYSEEGVTDRRAFLKELGHSIEHISGNGTAMDPEMLKGNIENFIGMAQIPIGVAGPMWVNGLSAIGDFFVPLATTEGALVASYNRGMKACRLSGGVTSVCLVEGVQRSPYFKFANMATTGIFIRWVQEQFDALSEIVKKISRHAQLSDIMTNMEGNSVILTFEYLTGDAAGQNMVTICTDALCKYILENFHFQPIEWYIEGNYSGDKKATQVSFSSVRGKKVSSEIVLPKKVVADVLKTSPERVADYWRSSTLAVVQSGAIGAQGHIANALTALYIACGQDVACVSESAVGITRMEVTANGDLYVAVTLPSLIVGTVGGGTALPTQRECLQMLGCHGPNTARKFAEICGAVALAGELSIASAMSVGHFTSAHQSLGRK